MARILVTGGTGIVGRHAVKCLRSEGHEVHLISRKKPSGSDFEFHQADLLNPREMTHTLDAVRPERILHLAWETEHGTYWHSPRNLDFVAATLHLAKEFQAQGGKRFVAAGTCAEYAWDSGNTASALDERQSACSPHTLYGQSKLATFQLLEKFAATTDLSFAWGRLFLLYGPAEQEKRLCPDVIVSLLKGQLVKCSSGRQIRDFMHTEDAGRAFAALLSSDVEGPVNIATGAPLPLGGFVGEIAGLMKRPDLVELGALPDRPDDPPQLIAATDRLMREVGFELKHSLQSGLQDTINWWRGRSTNQD